jgi:hypothetical protein
LDSYGPWDLIHRYLLPDWWIIPIYTTLTAWLASVVWWRRAVRFGRSWAQRLLRIIDDAPAARRLALRCVVAIPFLLVPVITMACWYMLGTMVWSLFAGLFDPASPTTLSRNLKRGRDDLFHWRDPVHLLVGR